MGDAGLTRQLDAAHAAVRDLTHRLDEERERGLELTFRDPLSGLPNRRLLEEHLTLALARSRRADTGVAVVHIDIDAFRLVNESLGYLAGNRVLASVAARLGEAMRSTDLLARPGGDEFLLLLADIPAGDARTVAEQAAARIVDALRAPFSLAGAEFDLECSLGIAFADAGAYVDAALLLEQADSAVFRAKTVARGGWAIYEQGAPSERRERLEGSTRLRRALSNDEFLLHYQPIFDVARGELIGVEALLRWHDPERGNVPPGDFIGLAEETGLIEAIGDWVVGAVCRQQAAWAIQGYAPQISFNVSPRQLRRLDFADRVAAHLAATGANPRKLTAELTESATMEDPAESEAILRALHALGLSLALDDFGSGYSSLSRLREMPVGTLKIDRAFMREVPDNHEASACLTAILSLSSALGRIAVAEGVETEAQLAFLAAAGCPLAQGFLLARPLPPAGVEQLLAATAA
ncbi:MAG: bifunctional diguanylate cyclase/phosphodiesterase [Solirubrobacteraceae bacterium]